MTPPVLEVADVLRKHGRAFLDAFGHITAAEQRRAIRDLTRCRTAALGGHVEACDRCGQRRVAYNSCRNRHCPKCQGAARARWLKDRAAELLPVEYFHVVFTLPRPVGPVALQNPTVVYGALFRAAAESMLQLAADPKHLGADIGFLVVLHTWGQNLQHHPHVHCVVPGGGLSTDGRRWLSCRPGFFLPVAVLRRLFRGKFLALLAAAFRGGRLGFHGRLQHLADPDRYRQWLDALRRIEWVVYAKRPFGGPGQVLKYLARYTHRVAISNHRLVKMEGDEVHFRWKDYAHSSAEKVMALDAVEFIRRFLQHVLPPGFVHIRHFGLLANRHRAEKLRQCRSLLAVPAETAGPVLEEPAMEPMPGAEPDAAHRCPHCGQGRMIVVEAVAPRRSTAPIGGGIVLSAAGDTS